MKILKNLQAICSSNASNTAGKNSIKELVDAANNLEILNLSNSFAYALPACVFLKKNK